MRIFIDTEIWAFAQKKPTISNFQNKEEFNRAENLNKRSKQFLTEQIRSNEILMTYHQLSEIYHVLGFRGMKLPPNYVRKYCEKLLTSHFMNFYTVSEESITKAMRLSLKSNIHIWDFLCVLPFIHEVGVLYSCDEHFKDEAFQSLGPHIENPLDEWLLL